MARLAAVPGRTLTGASVQALQLGRRLLGTASLERAVQGKVLVFTGLGNQVERDAVEDLRGAGATVVSASTRQGFALTDPTAVDELARSVLARHGRVDLLVNGAVPAGPAERMEDFQLAMQAGYFAPVRLALAFLPGMRARRSGHIVNLRESVPRDERAARAPWLTAHAALSSFSRCLAAEMLHERVAVSSYELPRRPGRGAASDLCGVIAERPKRAGR